MKIIMIIKLINLRLENMLRVLGASHQQCITDMCDYTKIMTPGVSSLHVCICVFRNYRNNKTINDMQQVFLPKQ